MENADLKKVAAVGEKVIKLLYNSSKEKDLNIFRFKEFVKCIKDITGSRSQFAKLPPTRLAAEMHSFRVFPLALKTGA